MRISSVGHSTSIFSLQLAECFGGQIKLGISPGLLNKWRARHRDDGQQAFVGKGHQTDLEEELRRLKRENEVLRQERDVLQKALVVFSRDGH